MKNKKAAFEMSMTTLVVIVLAVVMLILGLVFIRQIFGTATDSISVIDEQVKSKLKTMFGEEEGSIIVYNAETKIKPGVESFGIPLAARTQTGKTITEDHLQYEISVAGGDCISPESWFVYPKANTWNDFDSFDFDTGYVNLILNVPKGTAFCTSVMKIAIKDTTGEFASKTFIVKIVRGGLF